MHPKSFLAYQMIGKPIGMFFEFPENKTLEQFSKETDGFSRPLGQLTWESFNPENQRGIVSTALCDELVTNSSIHMGLSQCYLQIFKIDECFSMGIISFRVFIPAISELSSQILCITDIHGTIMGYNQALADFLRMENPRALLGKHMSDAVDLNEQIEERPNDNGMLHPLPLESGVFSPFESSKFILSTDNGLRWENRPLPVNEVQWMKAPVDYDYQDFRLTYRASRRQGDFPCLILRASKSYPPDNFGFLFGPRRNSDHWVLKKRGVEIASHHWPGLDKLAECTVSAEKRGRYLEFSVNGVPVISYRDAYPFQPQPGKNFAFLIRESALCAVDQITLHASDRRDPAPIAVYAVFKEGRGRKFRVYQEPCVFSDNNLFAYEFHDITHFEQQVSRLEKENIEISREKERMQSALKSHQLLQLFVGENGTVQSIKKTLQIIAESANSVLLTGETGTGKEVLANLVHQLSSNAGNPFVKVDCSVLPSTLLESELFGYEAGAFTGAAKRHIGRFEEANNGTLFLDEISNLSYETQAKLLGFLDDFTITRLGGSKRLRLNLTLVAATNKDLKELVEKNIFRQDLFYRLSRFSILIPPLRERLDDLPLLCQYFIGLAGKEYAKGVQGITEDGYKKLYDHSWPGNIRELKNVIFKAVLFTKQDLIPPENLDILPLRVGGVTAPGPFPQAPGARSRITRSNLVAALGEYEGNISLAAGHFGVSRNTLYNRMRKYGLRLEGFRAGNGLALQ